MLHLEFWKQTINHLHASHKFHQINWKTTPCLLTTREYLPYFSVNFNKKYLPASWLWLSIPFSDTDPMLKFCLPKVESTINVTNKLPHISNSTLQLLHSTFLLLHFPSRPDDRQIMYSETSSLPSITTSTEVFTTF